MVDSLLNATNFEGNIRIKFTLVSEVQSPFTHHTFDFDNVLSFIHRVIISDFSVSVLNFTSNLVTRVMKEIEEADQTTYSTANGTYTSQEGWVV